MMLSPKGLRLFDARLAFGLQMEGGRYCSASQVAQAGADRLAGPSSQPG